MKVVDGRCDGEHVTAEIKGEKLGKLDPCLLVSSLVASAARAT